MTDLVSATKHFREARKIADAAYETLLDAGERLMSAQTEYDRLRAAREEAACMEAYEAARTKVREARRVMGNLAAGIGVHG